MRAIALDTPGDEPATALAVVECSFRHAARHMRLLADARSLVSSEGCQRAFLRSDALGYVGWRGKRCISSAKHAIVDAQEQARTLGHGYIGSEHLLLGLLPVQPCAATRVLEALEIPAETLRKSLLAMLEAGLQPPSGHMPFTPAAKKALELSLRGAVALLLDYVGTEHLLLGIAREGSGAAGRALAEVGAEPDAIEREVAALREPRYRLAALDPLRGFLTDPDPE